MSDYISREAAFDAVYHQFCASSDETESALNAAIEEIRAIPAADVRPVVRGRWALCLKGEIACTNCGSRSKRKTNYCPNCGADMMEES